MSRIRNFAALLLGRAESDRTQAQLRALGYDGRSLDVLAAQCGYRAGDLDGMLEAAIRYMQVANLTPGTLRRTLRILTEQKLENLHAEVA